MQLYRWALLSGLHDKSICWTKPETKITDEIDDYLPPMLGRNSTVGFQYAGVWEACRDPVSQEKVLLNLWSLIRGREASLIAYQGWLPRGHCQVSGMPKEFNKEIVQATQMLSLLARTRTREKKSIINEVLIESWFDGPFKRSQDECKYNPSVSIFIEFFWKHVDIQRIH